MAGARRGPIVSPRPRVDRVGRGRLPLGTVRADIHGAKTGLSEPVQRAAAAEAIAVARNGEPAARLVALARPPARQPAGWVGRVSIAPDLDDAAIATLTPDGDGFG